MNIELYIERQLCDTGSPDKLGITLKRQFINPAELNLKDAQKSYTISLPTTDNNNRIFGMRNVEERKGKFLQIFDAQLIVEGITLLDGKFRLSEITADAYKGNLGVPAPKTIKDIFGDRKMTGNPPLLLKNFTGFTQSVNNVNHAALVQPQPCIFPYVLYGLLPKVRGKDANSPYSARDVWDDTVAVGIEDMPPSINVMQLLQHIFDEEEDYNLTGSALNDPRLNSLYMSYQNDADQPQPWNWGDLAHVKLTGTWDNADWGMDNNEQNKFERGYYETEYDGLKYYTGDLFQSTRAEITAIEDSGTNVVYSRYKDGDGAEWRNCQYRIPASGYYKVRLKADLDLTGENNERETDRVTNVTFVSGKCDSSGDVNKLQDKGYEIKLLRDFGEGDFGLDDARVNRRYFGDNLPQRYTGKKYNGSDGLNDEGIRNMLPQYFPTMGYVAGENGTQMENETMLVDAAENRHLVVGLSWGYRNPKDDYNRQVNAGIRYPNAQANLHGAVLAAKTGYSWDRETDGKEYARLAIDSPGYMKYGLINWYADDGDQPGIELPAENLRTGVVFDSAGRLVTAPDGMATRVMHRYKVPQGKSYGIYVPYPDFQLIGGVYVYGSADESEAYTEFVEFDTEGSLLIAVDPDNDRDRYVSMYLAVNDPEDGTDFDVQGSMRMKELDPDEEQIGWEPVSRYRIELPDAPANYARIGWHEGVAHNKSWYADGQVHAVVWLDQGERLTLAVSSDEGKSRKKSGEKGHYGWVKQQVGFELELMPYRTEKGWLQVNNTGRGTAAMSWNDDANFKTGEIDLVQFLPAGLRTDDFIDNVCKAFNLNLSLQDDLKTFSLDVKQAAARRSNTVIDLDALAAVGLRSNQSLGLPMGYSIGFTVDEEEEGYVKSGKDDGGGTIGTGAPEGDIKEQKSTLSYNWPKRITKREADKEVRLWLPVVSKAEVWTSEMTYPEAAVKRYMNSRQRFWYFDGLLTGSGATFQLGLPPQKKEDEEGEENTDPPVQERLPLHPAQVSNQLEGRSILSYKNEANTILNNYFSLLSDAQSHYTQVECHLTAAQYDEIGRGAKTRFNGDLYLVAEVDGYDPLGSKPARLKLIPA